MDTKHALLRTLYALLLTRHDDEIDLDLDHWAETTNPVPTWSFTSAEAAGPTKANAFGWSCAVQDFNGLGLQGLVEPTCPTAFRPVLTREDGSTLTGWHAASELFGLTPVQTRQVFTGSMTRLRFAQGRGRPLGAYLDVDTAAWLDVLTDRTLTLMRLRNFLREQTHIDAEEHAALAARERRTTKASRRRVQA